MCRLRKKKKKTVIYKVVVYGKWSIKRVVVKKELTVCID